MQDVPATRLTGEMRRVPKRLMAKTGFMIRFRRRTQLYHCHLENATWNWQYTKRRKQSLRRTYWMHGCRAYDTRTVGCVHVSRGTSLEGHYSAQTKSVTEPHYTFHQTNNPMAHWKFIYTKQVLYNSLRTLMQLGSSCEFPLPHSLRPHNLCVSRINNQEGLVG